MPKQKEIPAFLVFVVLAGVAAYYGSHFAPLFRQYFPEPKENVVLDFDLPPKPTVASVSPATPVPNKIGIDSGSAGASQPTASTTPKSMPTMSEAVLALDRYIESTGGASNPFAQQSLIGFPFRKDGKVISELEWQGQRREFVKKAIRCSYKRVGKAMRSSSVFNMYSMTVAVSFAQIRPDGEYQGIRLSEFTIEYTAKGSWLVRNDTALGDRVTMTAGRGISASAWKSGLVTTRMPANLRYIDNNSSPNSILAELRAGEEISYIPENDRWLVIKTDGGYVGFTSRNLIQGLSK